VFEFVHNAHVDGLAVSLLLAAFVVAIPPGGRRPSAWRDVGTGVLIGAAVLVKLYPALLLLAVLCLPRPRPWRSLARAAAAAGAGRTHLGPAPFCSSPCSSSRARYNRGTRSVLWRSARWPPGRHRLLSWRPAIPTTSPSSSITDTPSAPPAWRTPWRSQSWLPP